LNLGFRLVGRREQVLFARHCAERMERLVESRLEDSLAEPATRREAGILVSPAYPRT
jgi:hypothetical protein